MSFVFNQQNTAIPNIDVRAEQTGFETATFALG